METAVEIATRPERVEAPTYPVWLGAGLILVLGVALFLIRLAAPSNLLDQDQERPASYVLDVTKNGNWICQKDWTGDVTSKPPMWTWLAALAASVSGRVNLFALYWPGASAGIGSALLVYVFGRSFFGNRAALIGAIAVLLTTAGAKQLGLARTDGVFEFTVALAALLGFRSWETGRGWTWYWLVAAAATLTKGPVGPLLAGFGLFAALWEKKSGSPHPISGAHWFGILLFVVIVGGWFLLAYRQLGDALIAKMLGKELVGHAVQSGKGDLPGTIVYKQPLYYLGRGAPWSILAYLGLWKIWRSPDPRGAVRRFERFLFCWFTLGLLIFSLAPHQRADLLWPLMPAGALIAGRELDRFAQRFSPKAFALGFSMFVVVGVAGLSINYFVFQARTASVRQNQAVKQLAREIEQTGSSEFPITYVDAPMALQVYLDTVRPTISAKRAAELLKGPEAAFVALTDVDAVLEAMGDSASNVIRVAQTAVLVRKKSVTILSNRSELSYDDSFAFCFGSLAFKAHGTRLLMATEKEFRFQPQGTAAEVTVTNEGSVPHTIRVSFVPNGTEQKTLQASESWVIKPRGS